MNELDDETRAFLSEPRFAVLATINKDGTPQQSVVWYELRGDRLMLNTVVGRVKDLNLRRDPRLSLCVEDFFKYITIKGRVVEFDDNQERALADIRSLSIRYRGPEEGERYFRELYGTHPRVTMIVEIEGLYVYQYS